MPLTLVDALNAKRDNESLTDAVFARQLGLDPALWLRVRRDERRLNEGHIELILIRFPDLATLAFEYMRETGRRINARNGRPAPAAS